MSITLISIIVLLIFLINFSPVQTIIAKYYTNSLQNKTGKLINIGNVDISLFSGVFLKNVFIQDNFNDTLIYAGNIDVDINLFSSVFGEIKPDEIVLRNVNCKLKYDSNNKSNFSYLTDIFKSDNTSKNKSELSLNLNAVKVSLSNVKFIYNNILQGINLDINTKDLEFVSDTIDIEKLIFKADDIFIKNSVVKLEMNSIDNNINKNKIENNIQSDSNIDVFANSLYLEYVNFLFDYNDLGMKLFSGIKKGKIIPQKVDINNDKYFAKSIILDGAFTDIDFTKEEETQDTSQFYYFDLVPYAGVEAGTEKIELTNGRFSLDFPEKNIVSNHFDSNHLKYSDLNLVAKNAYYLKNNISGDIIKLSGKIPNSNIAVNNFSCNAILKTEKLKINKIDLKTNNSFLKGNFAISYKSFSGFFNDSIIFKNLYSEINSKIDVDEINYFLALDSIVDLSKTDNQSISLNTKIYGDNDSLFIKRFNAEIFENSQIIANAKIYNINNLDSLKYTANLLTAKLDKNDFTFVIPDSTEIYDISYTVIKGKIKADSKNIKSNFDVLTEKGSIAINFSKKDSLYKVFAKTENLDISSFTDSIQFKNIYASINYKSNGLDIYNNNFTISTIIDSAVLNNNKLQNIKLNADNNKGEISAKINSKNRNLNLNAEFKLKINDSIYYAETTGKIDEVNLKTLGLSNENAIIQGDFSADYIGKGIDSLTANIYLKNIQFTDKKTYLLNSMTVNAVLNDYLSNIIIKSDYLNGFIKSNYNFTQTTNHLTNFAQRYYFRKDSLPNLDSKISVYFKLNDDNIINRNLISGLNSLKTTSFEGNFNANENKINAKFLINNLSYNEIKADSINLDVNTIDSIISYNLKFKKINITDSFYVDDIFFTAKGNKNKTKIEIFDKEQDSIKYYFGLNLSYADSMNRIYILDKIILNNNIFKVNKDNFIDFKTNFFNFGLIELRNKEQSVIIYPSTKSKTLNYKISNFDLSIFSENNLMYKFKLKGILNSTGEINSQLNGKIVTDIKDLNIQNSDIGNLNFETNLINKKYKINCTVKGKGIDLDLKADNIEKLKLNTELKKLDLDIVYPFVSDIFTKLQGIVSSNFYMNEKYNFKGEIFFDNVKAQSRFRNSALSMNNQKIRFFNNKILVNNFTILDSAKNKFILNGKISDISFDYYKADLQLNTNNFTIFDANKEANERLYGKIIINNNSTIKGDINNLDIYSKIYLLKGSDITYVFPESEMMSEESTKGIVEFVKTSKDSILEIDTVVDNWYNNISLKSKIIVDENTELKIIFNDVAGESIYLAGGANINLDIDKGGNINVFGDYIIKKGYYDLSYYDIVQRKFDIKENSKITWVGDISNPITNITATYKVKTNPYPLMVTSGANEAELMKYKQNQIFLVDLNITGMLLYPEMRFSIEYPRIIENTNDQMLRSKINAINSDPGKANKQAVSLLLLSSFISDEDNFIDGGETFVNNSVSSILTSQLNKYSGKYLKGIDLDFDVNRHSAYGSDSETSGTQTDIKVKLKKSILNNRIHFEVAGGMIVTDEANTPNNSGNNSIHDASIEYYITKDGKYKLRAFSEKDYSSSINQDVQSSGISFVYTTKFDKPREIFIKMEKKSDKKKDN